MNKTGLIPVFHRSNKETLDDPSSVYNIQKILRQEMGDLLIKLHSDGRMYAVTYKWKYNEISIELQAHVLIVNPNDAFIGEYVLLGPVDAYLHSNMYKSFVYLNPEYLFTHDEIGWRRTYISEESKVEIRNEVKRRQGEINEQCNPEISEP